MIAFPNTWITVTRGTTTDTFGDTIASGTPVVQHEPAHLTEQRKRVFTEESPEPRIIRFTTCRLNQGVDVKAGDLIKDERTGVLYALDSFMTPGNPVYPTDMVMELKRTT